MAAPISRLHSVCPECGRVFDREDRTRARCLECEPVPEVTTARTITEARRGSRHSRGYGAAWTRLSRRARAQQPWCSDCGRTDSLSADHSPEAWRRHALGLPIRLVDVDVVCIRCNAERGPARGPDSVERPTMGQQLDDLDALADDISDDLDQRIARGELH